MLQGLNRFMNPFSDPLNIILLLAVLFVFWRLKGMLGERTGFERPPFDPSQFKRPAEVPKPNDKVIDAEATAVPDDQEKPPVWQGYAKEGSDVAQGLIAISTASPGFDPKTFIPGAKLAYEMVLEAFAKGDKKSLKPLLSHDVFNSFQTAIDQRAAQGHEMMMRFIGVKAADITSARMNGNRAELTLRLVGEMVSGTKDRNGAVVEGNLNTVREVFDSWTFERDVTSRNPNWTIIDTSDD
jgi:predicted lipid-binding transport protein (Tim44 family)